MSFVKRMMRAERQTQDGTAEPAEAPETAETAGESVCAQEVGEEELKMVVERRLSELFDGWIDGLRASPLCRRDDFLVRLYTAAKAFVLHGGKRLRPVACLQAYLLCGGPRTGALWAAAVDVAAAFEILHSSTLVHDDIMDGDVLRRGTPTLWKTLYDSLEAEAQALQEQEQKQEQASKEHDSQGPQQQQPQHPQEQENVLFSSRRAAEAATHAIIAGNMLVGEAVRVAERATRGVREAAVRRGRRGPAVRAAAEYLAEADVLVNHGQVLDVRGTEGDAEFLAMVALKTGELFRCAVLAGAALALGCARATEGVAQADADAMLAALARYAVDVAQAFQLYDDVMDISRESSKGHLFASDLRQGKNTLLVARALRAAPPAQAALLRDVLARARRGEPCPEALLGRAVAVIEDTSLASVLDTAHTLARSTALTDILPLWPAPCHITYFQGLAAFVVNRRI